MNISRLCLRSISRWSVFLRSLRAKRGAARIRLQHFHGRRHWRRGCGALLGSVWLCLPPALSASILPEMVLVEDLGNHDHPVVGYGAVNYAYQIGKYEVSNTEYAAFLNATAKVNDVYGLYHSLMSGISRSGSEGSYSYTVQSTMGDKPVNYVSAYDGARFANWLTNGQGSGGTETGVYQLGGVLAPGTGALQRQQAALQAGGYALASIDEWVKAGYYQPTADGGDVDGYWRYPTGRNLRPSSEYDVNYSNTGQSLWSQGLNPSGFAVPSSYYGTFHQGGNLYEWSDATDAPETVTDAGQLFILGSAVSGAEVSMNSDSTTFLSGDIYLDFESARHGIRIAYVQGIPEPAAAAWLVGLLCLGLVCTRR